MKEALIETVAWLKSGNELSQRELDQILRKHSRSLEDPSRRLSKRHLLAFFLQEKQQQSALWRSLELDDATNEALVRLLRAKPRRTASGVATVTVLTKPWPCGHDCIYCPNDVSMPKSYLGDEPACQRAERCFFDPYLQVAARLTMLETMGHNTDKVELIVLGGTWFDYPAAYRLWFACELFRALDDFGCERLEREVSRRRGLYEQARAALVDGEPVEDRIRHAEAVMQRAVDAGEMSYAQAFNALEPLRAPSFPQLDDAFSNEVLQKLQQGNEQARARCVGLVVETRPDTVSASALRELRRLGVTKVQVGVQSLNDAILAKNVRGGSVDETAQALGLIRLFGFKSHVHMMANLIGADPKADLQQYRTLMEDERFKPDEVKLYPCALVESARLTEAFSSGAWRPYSEEELVELLAACVLATPEYTRISRMIRDIPSDDILCGSKKTNLRQIVEERVKSLTGERPVCEMRMREVATGEVDADHLHMEEVRYETVNTHEVFLQWVDAARRLAGFLRLSLPKTGALFVELPIGKGEAMIREVHVYGRTSRLHEKSEGNQHLGLGKQLVERACQIAREAGYASVNVISAVGTRAYYRSLGFVDHGLYQRRELS